MYYSLITLGLPCHGISCTRVFYVIDNSFLAGPDNNHVYLMHRLYRKSRINTAIYDKK